MIAEWYIINNMAKGGIKKPEIIFGLVGAVGTDLNLVSETLKKSLEEFSYSCTTIRLSELMHPINNKPWNELSKEMAEDIRIAAHMDAGNELRRRLQRGDALAMLSIGEIRNLRDNKNKDPDAPIFNQAYILHSLKHPDEIKTLRNIYGKNFLLISAYSPKDMRIERLEKKIAISYQERSGAKYRGNAEELNERDQAEVDKFGQNVRETFPLADVFLDISDSGKIKEYINRFLTLLFSHEINTPTIDEYAMFHAKAAALRSASLSRQVGGVIATNNGEIIAVGTNEVPKAGGGCYWQGDSYDKRDCKLDYDKSDEMKRFLLGDVLKRLKEAKWLSMVKRKKTVEGLVKDALEEGDPPLMKNAQIMNIIEYGRSIHGEMAAICDAAMRGVSIRGCTLYTTTFPCHLCAGHIVAGGINRVIYIEPYPKSLVPELYSDSISIDKLQPEKNKVNFEPFVGIAPRKYMEIFLSETKRKEKDGKVIRINKIVAVPKIPELSELSYILKEKNEVKSFNECLKKIFN